LGVGFTLALSGCAGFGNLGTELGVTTVTPATVTKPQMQDMAQLLPEFNKLHPDIKINMIFMEENDLRNAATKNVATQGGQYDIMTVGAYEGQLARVHRRRAVPPGHIGSWRRGRQMGTRHRLTGSMAVLNTYGRKVELFAAGAISAERMVSHAFTLDDYDKALEMFREGSGRKLQVRPQSTESVKLI
jgi:hypothetical protein